MSYCTKCGAKLEDGDDFCPNCGAPKRKEEGDFSSRINDFFTPESQNQYYDPQDINQNKVFAVLSYLGFLFLIPLLAAKDSKFARFHCNQGIVIFLFSAVISVMLKIVGAIHLAIVLWPVILVLGFCELFLCVLAIIGIINAATGKASELPIIGKIVILK